MSNPYYQGPRSDHFDGQRFFNPGLPSSDKSLLDLIRWRLLGNRTPWPVHMPAVTGLRPSEEASRLRITAIGHASLLIQMAGCNILLDPVWAERASPFSTLGPRRHNPPAIGFEDLPPIHAVLVTHNHYDHMDVSVIRRLWKVYHPLILSPLGNDRVIQMKAPEIEVKTGDWWQSFDLPYGIKASIVPSFHWSSRGLSDRRMALWGGFVLGGLLGTIYCAGDTAYGNGKIFREIGERFLQLDVAVLPIGAYAPRWFMGTQHVNPEEAVQIALDCRAKRILGVHWGTFSLTDEPYAEPPERFYAAARSSSFDVANVEALKPGSIWHLK